jgi:nucleoid DNA-binding protein
MTKQELIERVATTLVERLSAGEELPKKTVAAVVDSVFAELGSYFIKAKITAKRSPRFTYPGFGTFTKKERAARAGRDPRSGDVIEIPASTTVGFQPGLELRASLNTRRAGDRKKANG